MSEGTGAGAQWVAPDRPSTPPSVAGSSPTALGPSAGVAVARGDARAERPRRGGPRDAADDPASALDGNPLRQLGVIGPGAVLDSAFALLRFRFGRLLALTAVVVVPAQALDLVMALRFGTPSTAEDLPQLQLLDSGRSLPFWSTLTVLALQAIGLFLLGMAVGVLVDGWLDGRDETFGTVVRAVARRAWVVPVVVLVAGTARFVAACAGGVGFFLVDALLFIAAPIAAVERSGPWATLGRSLRLTRSAYGNALVICVGGFVIASVVRVALALGPAALISMLGLPEGWMLVVEQAGSLTRLITLPLIACIAARAYIDLRCRAEGFDLLRRQEARALVA